ncbi:MAG: hypothetical protein HY040_01240 [Planctomycetes bacterium]|nr:hypothetical protein [Planctomycetota bacterium]
MPRFVPSRRVLGMPAWVWVIVPVLLILLGNMLWKIWPPSKLDEPTDRSDVFRESILVVPEGESFRFMPFSEHKGVKPLWAVTVAVHEKNSVSWDSYYGITGLFRRESRWTYELATHRFDVDWKDDKESSFALSAEQVRRLTPLVIAELNGRDPNAKLGTRLEGLLKDGRETKSYVCAQNAVILLGWLSVPLGLIGLCSMFIRPRAGPGQQGASSV